MRGAYFGFGYIFLVIVLSSAYCATTHEAPLVNDVMLKHNVSTRFSGRILLDDDPTQDMSASKSKGSKCPDFQDPSTGECLPWCSKKWCDDADTCTCADGLKLWVCSAPGNCVCEKGFTPCEPSTFCYSYQPCWALRRESVCMYYNELKLSSSLWSECGQPIQYFGMIMS